ncbi:MAG: hypothetical protein AB2747_05430 [Candidatus Thiodiazotropha taylori]
MIQLDAIDLPGDLEWIDEHTWSPVGQSLTYSLTGALIVEEATQQTGRPITLQGGRRACWVTKTTLEALQAKADQAGLAMVLNYSGTNINVMFKRDQGLPIEARLVRRIENPGADDYYYITLRLMEI